MTISHKDNVASKWEIGNWIHLPYSAKRYWKESIYPKAENDTFWGMGWNSMQMYTCCYTRKISLITPQQKSFWERGISNSAGQSRRTRKCVGGWFSSKNHPLLILHIPMRRGKTLQNIVVVLQYLISLWSWLKFMNLSASILEVCQFAIR